MRHDFESGCPAVGNPIPHNTARTTLLNFLSTHIHFLCSCRRSERHQADKNLHSLFIPFFSLSKLFGTTARLKGRLPESKCFFLRRRELLDIHRGLSSTCQKKGDPTSSYAAALLLSHGFSPLAPHFDLGFPVVVPTILLEGRD